jgi:ribosomal protein S18 acetylase RimI-like enzyme
MEHQGPLTAASLSPTLAVVFELRSSDRRDADLMWKIQRQAMGEYVAAEFGTSAEEQRGYFDDHFEVLQHQVVVVDGADAGYLLHETRGDHVYVRNVALLPEYQGRGIGTAIMSAVIEHADAHGLPVRLQVLKTNPRAKALYERLGFRVDRVDAHHVQMVRANT